MVREVPSGSRPSSSTPDSRAQRASEAADADSGADVLCPCLYSHPEAIENKYDKEIDGKQCLAYTPPGSTEEYCYPPEYGLGN